MSSLWYLATDCILLFIFAWIIEDCILALGVEPPIPGIKQIPSYPIVGNLLQVKNNPAKVYLKWSKFYKVPVFQVRLGFRNIVVANSYQSVEFLWGKSASANNSRPTLHIFHNIVSQSQGFTIGSSPASSSLFKTKQALSLELNRKSVNIIAEQLDQQVKYAIRMIIRNNVELKGSPSTFMSHVRSRLSDIDLLPYFQLFALRSAIQLTYGITLDCYGKHSRLSQEIIEVENQIIKLRGQGSWLPDFLPFLKYFGNWELLASKYRLRRDNYMNELSREFKKRYSNNDVAARTSLLGRLYKNSSHLAHHELNSICLTMVSAGLDNTPLTINHLMGHLSRPDYGYALQQVAFSQLLNCYGDINDAWNNCGTNMECNFVVALVQEALRFFTVLPLSLPRKTTKVIKFNGVVIPEGTVLYMNAYAANHDSVKFLNPMKFDPFRWLVPRTMKLKDRREMDHFAFGAGSRKCSGNILATQEMYSMICRLILIFRIRRPIEEAMELDPFESNACPSATSFEPKRFKVHLEPRCHEGSDSLYRLLQ